MGDVGIYGTSHDEYKVDKKYTQCIFNISFCIFNMDKQQNCQHHIDDEFRQPCHLDVHQHGDSDFSQERGKRSSSEFWRKAERLGSATLRECS